MDSSTIIYGVGHRRHIRPIIIGVAMAALVCVSLGRAVTLYAASMQQTRYSSSTLVATSRKSTSASGAVATAPSPAPTPVAAPVAVAAKPAINTAVPACAPDTADLSLSTLDLSGAAPGLTQVIDATHHYQIYGNNDAQIRSQIINCAPKLSAGEYTAYTSYKLSWQYSFADDGTGQCHLTNVKVGMHIAEILPTWTAGSATSASFASQWQSFIINLNTHEQGHVALNVQYAGQILSNLQNFPATSCSSVNAAVSSMLNAQVSQLNTDHANYDTNTNYGATQGAILP